MGAFRGGSFVDALRLLDRLTCRIGLIGQVKAGKSSLSNALACKPDMLPTDVNPFTTVVTHLHFGRTDVPVDVAAEFTFFQADEWMHLAAGVKHVRELTERLMPGFDVEQLHKQVEALRRRSEERLGPALGSLLGQKHVFPSLSTELLKRYVSSDLSGTGTDDEDVYSDIVKAADLYFSSNDFGFPTTIIDTPGSNDPFLVRDEIARRALESAHVHIVVLTARQAISSADLALLRVLQGLRKDRIAVFINRIDELNDIARDVPTIVQHVRSSLRRELPTLELPVVTGSAYWANAALRGSQADVERAWSPKAKTYAQHLTQRAGSVAGHDRDEQLAQSLLLCSGLPALLDVLADLTPGSHAGRVLKRISRSFCELAKVSANAARQELAVAGSEVIQSGDDYEEHGENELRAVDAEAKEHERLTTVLQDVLTDMKERSALAISEQCGRISSALHEVVRGFSEAECRNMRAAIVKGRRGVWRCDPVPLQRRLEERLVGSHREAEQELANLEADIFPQLKELLKRYSPRWGEPGPDGGNEPGSLELPLLAVLGVPSISMELGEPPRWRWRRGRDGEKRIAELAGVIEAEWRTITHKLVQTARAHLEARQSSIVQEASQVYAGVVEVFKEQNRARLQRARALIDNEKKPDRSDLERNREVRMAELKARISDLDRVAGRLEKINREMCGEDRTSQ